VTVEEHLAVPYKLISYAAKSDDGTWKRRAHFPELDLWADADTLVEAIELLEEKRVDYIVEALAAGDDIPVPRPPLRSLIRQLPADTIREVERRIRSQSPSPR
jgi:hypothetical protein